jgi:hypothetical protein
MAAGSKGEGRMLFHIVADYGAGDLAFAEVAQRVKLHLPDAEPIYTPIAPFETLVAGFCVAQLGLNSAPANTVVYHNVAPRQDEGGAREGNEGERLACALLPNGVRAIGVNAGYAFSFVRAAAEELRWASVPAEGSQFRSRDLFPEAVADIVAGRPGALGRRVEPSAVPEVPENRIAYIDGYGNLKTTAEQSTLGFASGTTVRVRIGAVELTAKASDGTFGVERGELSFAPGSSGWTKRDGEEVRWMELFLRDGSAWEAFGRPQVGAEVIVDS